jgi:hypothetical protein
MPPGNGSVKNVIRPEAVDALIRQLEKSGYYGDVTVRFRNGEITLIETKQSFVDEEQVYNSIIDA